MLKYVFKLSFKQIKNSTISKKTFTLFSQYLCGYYLRPELHTNVLNSAQE